MPRACHARPDCCPCSPHSLPSLVPSFGHAVAIRVGNTLNPREKPLPLSAVPGSIPVRRNSAPVVRHLSFQVRYMLSLY